MAKKDLNLSRHRRRSSSMRVPDDQLARIDILTRTARTTWFGLLFFLTFVSVALTGVRDVDFFLTDRETPLPLVGIAVPTFLFFSVTPLLGGILYAYFHMHLLKLWEELASAPEVIDNKPLSDRIMPWLISDLALAYRCDRSLKERPLRQISHWINLSLAFWGAPVVLTFFWARSFAPHYDWLTLIACGGPLSFSVYVGAVSWQRLQELCGKRKRTRNRFRPSFLLVTFVTLLTLAGWLFVEGTLKNYAIAIGIHREGEPVPALLLTPFPSLIYSANLVETNFSRVPEPWISRQQFRQQYRVEWCRNVGIPEYICGPVPDDRFAEVQNSQVSNSVPKGTLAILRSNYCQGLMGNLASNELCEEYFTQYDDLFEVDWRSARQQEEAALTSFDFSFADLRNARLDGSFIQNGNFEGAQLDGASLDSAELQNSFFVGSSMVGTSLYYAQLEGADFRQANLSRAQLGGANLQGAQFGGTNLSGASLGFAKLQAAELFEVNLSNAFMVNAGLQGANLYQSNLSNAVLEDAKLQGAGLSGAILAGANLTGASLNGALLSRTVINSETELVNTSLRGAALRRVDLSNHDHLFHQYKDAFIDGSVRLYSSHPLKLRKRQIFDDFNEFRTAWRDFQRSIGQDPNDP